MSARILRKTGAIVANRCRDCCSAARELGFDPARALVIGDKPCDIELGRAVGATTILVRTGYGAEHAAAGAIRPDYVADDLLAAAEIARFAGLTIVDWRARFGLLEQTMSKRALITGITGQDGSYLAEFLLSKGYEVHGLTRRSSTFNRGRIDHISEAKSPGQPAITAGDGIFLHYGDLCDASSVNRLLRSIRPDEIYNLAAQSHVKVSFEIPEYTGDVAGLGTLRILEGIRESGLNPRIYQAGSSEMFGKVAGDTAEGKHPVLSPLALCRGQSLCPLAGGQLSRGLRHVRLQRHLVQSRVAAARRELRDAQDHAGGRRHQARLAKGPGAGQSGGQARLGLCRRLRAGHVVDAAAGAVPTTT